MNRYLEKRSSIQEVFREFFDIFLASLSQDLDQASEKYLLLRSKIALYFRLRGYSDPEGLTDIVLDRIIKKMGEEKIIIDDIYSYALGVAKNVSREYERSTRLFVPFEAVNNITAEGGVFYEKQEEEEREQNRYQCLQHCLSHLTESNREILLAYYASKAEATKHREKMSHELGITVNTLRVRVHRIRESLHRCILKCLNS